MVELKVGQKIKREHRFDDVLGRGESIGTIIKVTKTFAEVSFGNYSIKISLKKSYEGMLRVCNEERFSMVSYSLIKESENI